MMTRAPFKLTSVASVAFSHCGPAAVHWQYRAGDIRGFVRSEKERGGADLARQPHAPEKRIIDLIGVAGMTRRRRISDLDSAGRDHIHANVVLAVVTGGASGKTDQSRFDGRIADRVWARHHALNGGRNDDGTALLRKHPWQNGTSKILCPHDRSLKASLPLRFRRICQIVPFPDVSRVVT